MAGLDDLFNDLLDDDLLRQAAEEEERLKASDPQPPPPKRIKPTALLFKPSTVTKAQNRQTSSSSVVVSSAAPTVNREYLAQFVPHLAAVSPPPAQQRAKPEIPLPPPTPATAPFSFSSAKATPIAAAAEYRLFVGNLAADAREDALVKVFKDYPSVSNIQVVLDKDKAKCQGYGFVTFQDPFEMLKALKEKNGKLCFNRPMQISKAKPESDPSKKYKSMARKPQ